MLLLWRFERSDIPALAANRRTFSLPARFQMSQRCKLADASLNCFRQTLIWFFKSRQRSASLHILAGCVKRPVCNWVESSPRSVVLIFLNTVHLHLSVISGLVICCWEAMGWTAHKHIHPYVRQEKQISAIRLFFPPDCC